MTLMKPTKALLWQHSCTSGGVCVQFLLLLPPLHVWKYSVGLSKPYSGDPLLGKLPTLSDGTCCRAGKLRPEQNALSPKQHFVGWEGTLPSRCQRSVARSSVMGTFYRQGQPPLPDSVVISGRGYWQPRHTERCGEEVALLHEAKSGRAQECHTG